MDWQEHFGAVFFETWQKSGLPLHQNYINEYVEIRENGDSKSGWIKNTPNISPNLNGARLHSVYGFGVTVGKIFAEMFGLKAQQTEEASDWCGRFNLGISLFDYMADEMGGMESLTSLKVFQPFLKGSSLQLVSLTPAQDLLNKLAGSVLLDLEKAGMDFMVIKQMFGAEHFISNENLSGEADLPKIEGALYLKSAEPFRVMAEYTARMANSNDGPLMGNALAMGKALGYCYWLIDDAKDVWIDVKEGHWNLFLTRAARENPMLFGRHTDSIDPKDLEAIWSKNNFAQKQSDEVIIGLTSAIVTLELSPETEQHTMGLVAASLWQWYQYG